MTSSGRPIPARTTTERLRLTAMATVLLGVGALAVPGAAGAAGTSVFAGASAGGAAVPSFAVRADDDDRPTSAEDADADAETAADDGSDPAPGADDGPGGVAGEDDGFGVDDADAPADGEAEVIPAVVVDAKGRTVSGPKALALSRTVKISGITWTGWNAATTTGRGRVVVKKKGRRAKTVRGAGTVVLSGLKICPDATPLYRKATVTVAGRKVAKVTLPNCSAMR